MQQILIPARSTSPQNDELLMKLISYIEKRCPKCCDRGLCSVGILCNRWFNGVSDSSAEKHPLTEDEYWRAVSKFDEIKKRAGRV